MQRIILKKESVPCQDSSCDERLSLNWKIFRRKRNRDAGDSNDGGSVPISGLQKQNVLAGEELTISIALSVRDVERIMVLMEDDGVVLEEDDFSQEERLRIVSSCGNRHQNKFVVRIRFTEHDNQGG